MAVSVKSWCCSDLFLCLGSEATSHLGFLSKLGGCFLDGPQVWAWQHASRSTRLLKTPEASQFVPTAPLPRQQASSASDGSLFMRQVEVVRKQQGSFWMLGRRIVAARSHRLVLQWTIGACTSASSYSPGLGELTGHP